MKTFQTKDVTCIVYFRAEESRWCEGKLLRLVIVRISPVAVFVSKINRINYICVFVVFFIFEIKIFNENIMYTGI